jgi:hypothetical protein
MPLAHEAYFFRFDHVGLPSVFHEIAQFNLSTDVEKRYGFSEVWKSEVPRALLGMMFSLITPQQNGQISNSVDAIVICQQL